MDKEVDIDIIAEVVAKHFQTRKEDLMKPYSKEHLARQILIELTYQSKVDAKKVSSIAAELGISGSEVSQVHKRITHKMIKDNTLH